MTQQGTLDALACYCQAWSRWTAAEQQVNALGAVVKSAAGFAIPNPYIAIAAAAAADASMGRRAWPSQRPGRRKAKDDEGDQGQGLLRLLGAKGKRAG